ncbi:MAG: prenyltransferase [Gammaproteobacteria bacterium]|nr:prenyltransferase [Gammaproteobacteria bacterium]
MSEPTSDIYHCQTTGNIARTCFDAVRPAFLSASILPVLSAFAYVLGVYGSLDYLLALLTLISIACIHSSANVLNDYFDSKNGTDKANLQRVYPFSGGSRFIQNGVLSEDQTFKLGSVLLLAGIVFGLIIAYISGPVILLIGFIGAVLAVFYSAPPCLACKGLGDLTIAACFGLLPVIGTVYSQTGAVTNSSIWLGLVIGCFVAAILWINSIPDIDADKNAGKHTWPARLNNKVASWMHGAWFICGFGMILFTPIGAGYLALLATVPATIAVVSVIRGNFIPAIPMTLVTHAMVCILLGAGFLIA